MSPNAREENEFLERLSELARGGMPLPASLRAAASDASSRSLARQLNQLADQLESGKPWGEVLCPENTTLRPHVLGILRAAVQSGNLAEALDDLIDQQRAYRDTRREVVFTLAYPTFLLGASLTLTVSVILLIVPQFDAIFVDFGTELPRTTEVWIKVSREMPNFLTVCGSSVAVSLLAIRLFGGRSGWMRFLSSIPVAGTMLHDAGVVQWLRLLEILLNQRMPLPQALQLASAGVSNRYVRRLAGELARETQTGIPLSRLIESDPRIPAVIAPVLGWGESCDALPIAIRDAYTLLEGRIYVRRSILSIVVGPLMFVVIGILLGSLMVALLMPLFSVMWNLT